MKAMLAKETADVSEKLKDLHWFCEPKYDGIRALVHVMGDVEWRNRNDEPLTKRTPPSLHAILDKLPPGIILDGEIVGGRYYVFDLPHFGTSLAGMSFYRRRRTLEQVMAIIGPDQNMRLSEIALGDIEKRKMLQRATQQRWEGLVFKHGHGLYLDGRRSEKMLKFKFTKEIDCIVIQTGVDGKENATLGIWEDGRVMQVGTCSLVGKGEIQQGDVVQVRYLYYQGSALVQPRLIRVRRDKAAYACTSDQLANAHAIAEPR